MSNVKIILGGPGTGKTTRLMEVLDTEMSNGVPPSRIAFVSFTQKAATEALERACAKFDFNKRQFPHFRTIHSTAYREVGISQNNVMKLADHRQIAGLLGLQYAGRNEAMDGVFMGEETADMFLSVVEYAKATDTTLREAWHNVGAELDWFKLRQYAKTLQEYKSDLAKVDFSDMLDLYVERGLPLDIDVAIIDEAQDLSTAQWRAVNYMTQRAQRTYIAGDDDQAIYRWSGADVDYFVGLTGDVEILPVSHRLPQQVHKEVVQLTGRIKNRRDKQYQPTDKHGSVDWINDLERDELTNRETWYLLARNGYTLRRYTSFLRDNGLPYLYNGYSSLKQKHVRAIVYWERLRSGKTISGEDANAALAYMGRNSIQQLPDDGGFDMAALKERGLRTEARWFEAFKGMEQEDINYYLDVLRNGYKLNHEPEITVSTIHGVKGGEADNVVLSLDMTYRSHQSMLHSPDDEHRVFFVGASRAKKNLHYLTPQTGMYYAI